MISNLRLVLNVECILLGNAPASEFYMPAFRNTLSVPFSYLPAYEDGTECSETLAYKVQKPGNYPEESMQDIDSLVFLHICYPNIEILNHTKL